MGTRSQTAGPTACAPGRMPPYGGLPSKGLKQMLNGMGRGRGGMAVVMEAESEAESLSHALARGGVNCLTPLYYNRG